MKNENLKVLSIIPAYQGLQNVGIQFFKMTNFLRKNKVEADLLFAYEPKQEEVLNFFPFNVKNG